MILDLLAGVLDQDAADLRRELERRSSELPIDSLDAVEILVQLEDRFGIQLDDREASRTMRSVRSLAGHVVEVLAGANEGRRGA